MKNRKGQAQALPTGAMAIVLAIILVALSLILIVSLRNSSTVAAAYRNSSANETITGVSTNDTVKTLLCNSNPNPACTLNAFTNASGGQIIPSANFTITNCGFKVLAPNVYNNSNVNVSYSCTYADPQTYKVANSSFVGFSTFNDFLPLIIIALVLGLVITIVVFGFGLRKNR